MKKLYLAVGIALWISLSGFMIASMGSHGTASGGSALLPSSANIIGLNIDAPITGFEAGQHQFADMMKTSNSFSSAVDANGWPTANFNFVVWSSGGGTYMNGTYSLVFTGQATVTSSANATMGSGSYNSGTNKTTYTFTVASSGSTSLTLTFTGTKRLATDSAGTGVTNISIMRPITPGSSTDFAIGDCCYTPFLTGELSKVSIIRYMDFTATNWKKEVNWADRPLPGAPSWNRSCTGCGWQGEGAPWEYVVLFANASGKDAWINIPEKATDTYVTNLANLFKYGSDGTNPYTSVQGSPVYPPLDAGLHVYVEYSNEVWNGSFAAYNNVITAATAELNAGSSPMNWDSKWSSGTASADPFLYRYVAERIVNISNDFRAVFGDSAMGDTIRPVLMSQWGNGTARLSNAMVMLMEYYNNMTGSWVGTAHPPSYYLYAAGGANYYNPNYNTSASYPGTVDALFSDSWMASTGPYADAYAKREMYVVKTMGLHGLQYEGGPNFITTSNSTINSVYASAVNDSRITGVIEDMHTNYVANGGDGMVYLTAAGNYEWGFTSSINSLSTYKLAALDDLNANPRVAVTYGTAIPGTVTASSPPSNPYACNKQYSCGYTSFTGTFSLSNNNWTSYLFIEPTGTTRTVTLTFSAASGTVAVYLDGAKIDSTKSASVGTVDFSAGTVAEGQHSIVISAKSGTFTLTSTYVH